MSQPWRRSSESSRRSNSSRASPLWLLVQVGRPSRFAATSPRASGTFEATRAMSYQRGSRRLCSESAIMLVPRPEISTPTRARSGMVARRPIVPRRPGAARAGDGAAAFAGLDSADVEHDFSRLFKSFRYVFRINLGDDDGHADAAVEGARHLLRLDIP